MSLFDLLGDAIGFFGDSADVVGDVVGDVADLAPDFVGDLPGEELFLDTATGEFVTAAEMAAIEGSGIPEQVAGSDFSGSLDDSPVSRSTSDMLRSLEGGAPATGFNPANLADPAASIASADGLNSGWLKALAQGGAGLASSLLGAGGGLQGLAGLKPVGVVDPGLAGTTGASGAGLPASPAMSGVGGLGGGDSVSAARTGALREAGMAQLAAALGLTSLGRPDTPGRDKVNPLDVGAIPTFSPLQIPLAQGAPAQMAQAQPRLTGLQRLQMARR